MITINKNIKVNRVKNLVRLIKPFALLGGVILFSSLQSCKPDFYEEPAPAQATPGTVSFSKYVAVGSTISAGFADNALYTEGQNNAYPNLLAAKFKEVNTSLAWFQPDINSTNGWSGTANTGKSILVIPACSTVAVGGVPQTGESAVLPYTGSKSAVTNLSVPFLRITDVNTAAITAGTAYNNPKPYFDRIVDPATTLGIASEAKQRQASFFTINLGYVDALRYATSGGTTALVSTASFQANIEQLLDSLLSVPGSKGAIALIPYVDQFPVVTNNNRRLTSTTDPAKNPIRFTQAQADAYNTAIGQTLFSGAAGNKNFYAITTGSGSIRQLNTSKDFIVSSKLLDTTGIGKVDSAAVRTCTPNLKPRKEVGFATAIANKDVLDKDEIVALRAQIDDYNNAIKAAVNARNANGVRIAIVDLNAFYTKLTDPNLGIQYGTTIIRANHPSLGPDFGGFYSLDRYTPTPKGQALIANEFLTAINTTFGSSFSLYDPNNFRGNDIP